MKRLSALFAALLVLSALAACRTNKETDRISQSSVPVQSTVSDTLSDSVTAASAASEAPVESAKSSEPPKPEIVHVDGIKLSAYERTITVGDRFMPIVTMSPANAYKYGFILRYPEGKESITGYMYEPWHYRYVGVESAKKIFDSGLTIEEYFGITSTYGG